MGEILRGVLDQEALIARPRWYVSNIALAATTVNRELIGHIKIQQNTQFLWTSFGFHQHGITAGAPTNNFGGVSEILFREFASGKRFSNVQNVTLLSNTYPFGVTDLEQYTLLPGDYRLGWSLTPRTVTDTDAYYLLFGGIEYVMPKSNAAYGIDQLGG